MLQPAALQCEPALEALEVDQSHRALAFAGVDQRVVHSGDLHE